MAEEIVFGDVSTGAANDLQRATDIARHMVAQYSMSDKLGLATFEEPRQAFLAASAPAPREYSGATAEAIDLEITAILDAAHRRVSETLTGHRATLEPIFHRRSASIVSIGSRIARYQPRIFTN